MKIKTLFMFCLLCVFSQKGSTQNDIYKIPDSLKTKSEDYLLEKVNTFYSNPKKANIYAYAYVDKNKISKDSSDIVRGFYMLSDINIIEPKMALKLIDSSIIYNKNNSFENVNPTLWTYKGNVHYGIGEYKKALESYLQAKKELDPSVKWNPKLSIDLDFNISLIMLEFTDFDGAIKNFDSARKSIEEAGIKEKYISDYLEILHKISTTYWYKNKLDSAIYYNDLQYREAIFNENLYHKNKSRVTRALIQYKTGNFQSALDSISKYETFVEETKDSTYLAVVNLYKGKAYQKLGNQELAIKAFKKVDTIIEKTGDYSWELEENYEILNDYYREKGDLKKQLLYIEKLIDFDSILYRNNTYLKNTILTKYNTPKLITEKETLISTLEKSDNKKSKIIFLISILALILLVLTLYYNNKRINDKKRFEELLRGGKLTLKENIVTSQNTKQLTIPQEIIEEILKKIKHFEEKKGFLDNTITLNKLSKKLGTNSNYLSRTINFHKNKNFSTYLSHLRIDHAVHILKEEPKFREYTIKAIAHEVGFNSVETFTTAFHKHTKIYPSYFIKQLKKEKN